MCAKKNSRDFDNYSIVATIRNSTARSENNKVFPPSVKISFMRYGLVKEENKFYEIYPEKDEPDWQSPDGAPDVIDFKYVRTTLRPGWIYIYTEDTNKIYKFATNDGGVTPYVLLRDKTIWAAYSEVEWSPNYYCSMRDDASERQKRMQKISYADWYNDQRIPDGVSYNNANAVFFQNDYLPPWKHKTDIANAFVNDNNEDKKEYVFFCLHDPLSVADVLTANLNLKWMEMESLLISMQTGLEKSIVLDCLKNGMAPEKIAKKQEPHKREQIEALFKTSLLLYQSVMAMDPTEGIDHPMNKAMATIPGAHYGGPSIILTKVHLADYLDKDRIRKILGKKERDTLKEEIKKAKNELAKYLESAYYQNILLDYSENSGFQVIEGRWRISMHYQPLAFLPNAKDKYLGSKQDNEIWTEKGDTGIKHLEKLINNTIPSGKVFKKKITVEVKTDRHAEMVMINLNSIWNCMGEYVKNHPEKRKTFVSILNNTETKITDSGQTLNKIIEETDLNTISNGNIPAKINKEALNIDEKIWNDITEKTSFSGIVSGTFKQIRFSDDFIDAMEQKSAVFKRISNSMRWNRFLAGVSYLNVGWALIELSSSKNKPEEIKNITSLLSSMVFTFSVSEKIKDLRGIRRTISNEAASFLKSPRYLGALGAWLDAVVDVIDAGINLSECDYDAALALLGSAACGVLYGIGLISGWPPAAIIALLVAGLGFGLLAGFLEDSPFERLVKNCPLQGLGKGHVASKGNYLDVINYNYTNRNKLAKKNFLEWGNYIRLYESITDILFSGRVELIPSKKDSDLISNGAGAKSVSCTESLKIEIKLPKQVEEITTFDDYALYIVPEGLHSRTEKTLIKPRTQRNGKAYTIIRPKDENAIFVLNYDIPEIYFDEKYKFADLIFYYRLKLQNGLHVYPIEKGNSPRYMAIKERLRNSLSIINVAPGVSAAGPSGFMYYYNNKIVTTMNHHKVFGEKIRAGTIDELFKLDIWN